MNEWMKQIISNLEFRVLMWIYILGEMFWVKIKIEKKRKKFYVYFIRYCVLGRYY